MKKHIIIAGCPAVGKRTIATDLSRMTGIPFFEYSSFLLSVNAARYINNEIIINEKKAKEAFDSLSSNYIISGTYALRLVDKEEVINAVVIRCNPFVLYYRYIIRNYELIQIRENLTAEFVDKCLAEAIELLGKEKVMQVDVTFETPYISAAKIGNALKSKTLIFDKVDWLSYIHDYRQLKKFMI
ncbi:MAG: AAA family ATPase [Conexivisphaerales archaeon]